MDNATIARATMGMSLGFHMVFAVLGVGMPLLVSAAEGLGLWRRDEVWLRLARRWARAFGVLFAVGAVSGTVLSFELGLLWPRFMAFSGSIIGLPFSAEAFAFFIEAIFLGLYLYGWDRLRPLTHWLCSLPIALSGAASSVFVVTANAWMNTPAGFTLKGGQLASVDPLAAAFNPAAPTEDLHSLLAAYVVTGFVVAAVYAMGTLRGRWDAIHRRALPLAMVMALAGVGLAGVTGDSSARFVYQRQPVKFAAQEGLFQTGEGVGLTIGGIPLADQRRTILAVKIPHALSFLANFDPNSRIVGLNDFNAADEPDPLLVHLAFQAMVGLGGALGVIALAYWLLAWRRRRPPLDRWLLWGLVASGPLSVVVMETGWLDTEFGRQPFVVSGIMRTADAATTTPALFPMFVIFIGIYLVLGVTCGRLLLRLARRGRAQGESRILEVRGC